MGERAKHTPGPWEISSLDGRTIHRPAGIYPNGVPRYEGVAVALHRESRDETEANAHLLAAAPALLAACKAWVAYFDWLARNDEPGDPLAAARKKSHGERVEATRDAIKAAEGGA